MELVKLKEKSKKSINNSKKESIRGRQDRALAPLEKKNYELVAQ